MERWRIPALQADGSESIFRSGLPKDNHTKRMDGDGSVTPGTATMGPLGVPEAEVQNGPGGRLVDIQWSTLSQEQKRQAMKSAPVLEFDDRMAGLHGTSAINWSKHFRYTWDDVYVGYDNNNDINVIAATENNRLRGDLRLNHLEGINGAGGNALEFLKRQARRGNRSLAVPVFAIPAIRFYLNHQMKMDGLGKLVAHAKDLSGSPVKLRKDFSQLQGTVLGHTARLNVIDLLRWVAEMPLQNLSPGARREELTRNVEARLGKLLHVWHEDRKTKKPVSDGWMSLTQFVDQYLAFPIG